MKLCGNGLHRMTPENTRLNNGYRVCLACLRIRWAKVDAQRKRERAINRRQRPTPKHLKELEPCPPHCPACLWEQAQIERRTKTHAHLLELDQDLRRTLRRA